MLSQRQNGLKSLRERPLVTVVDLVKKTSTLRLNIQFKNLYTHTISSFNRLFSKDSIPKAFSRFRKGTFYNPRNLFVKPAAHFHIYQNNL